VLTSSYRIVEGPHGDVRIQLREKQYSVPEVSAMVLQEMKVIAEDYLGHPVTKAVVTVPAYFNDNQRQAPRTRADRRAGRDQDHQRAHRRRPRLRFGKRLDQTIAVYDLGGGTFDISILEIGEAGIFKVIATAGDTFLGGEDFDARIIDWLVTGFQAEHNIDLRQDRMALQRLRDGAEKAKCELSTLKRPKSTSPSSSPAARTKRCTCSEPSPATHSKSFAPISSIAQSKSASRRWPMPRYPPRRSKRSSSSVE